MWAPSEVVQGHRKRATFVWVLFILLIMSYTVWLFVDVAEKMKNPSISISIKPDRYEFPTLSMCFHSSSSCFTEDNSYCVASAKNGISIIGQNGFNDTELDKYDFANITDFSAVYSNCLDIRLGEIPETELEQHHLPPFLLLGVIWNADWFGNATEGAYFQTLDMYITDPNLTPHGDHNETKFVGSVPYNAISPGQNLTSIIKSDMMIENTETITLSKEATKAYAASSFLQTELVMIEPWPTSFDVTYGWVVVNLLQPSLSHTIRREIHPLEWAEIFGNIGGCWELLLVLWGVLFVAVRAEEPRLMGRDFKDTGVRAVQSVRDVAVGLGRVATSTMTRRTDSMSVPGENAEAIPAWDREGHSNAQRETIPGPAFNPATSGSFPRPVEGFPLRPGSQTNQKSGEWASMTEGAIASSSFLPLPQAGQSTRPGMNPRHSAPIAPGMLRRQEARSHTMLSSSSFRSSSCRISTHPGSNTSSRVEASKDHPVPSSLPVPHRSTFNPNESRFATNESKVEIPPPRGHSPV